MDLQSVFLICGFKNRGYSADERNEDWETISMIVHMGLFIPTLVIVLLFSLFFSFALFLYVSLFWNCMKHNLLFLSFFLSLNYLVFYVAFSLLQHWSAIYNPSLFSFSFLSSFIHSFVLFLFVFYHWSTFFLFFICLSCPLFFSIKILSFSFCLFSLIFLILFFFSILFNHHSFFSFSFWEGILSWVYLLRSRLAANLTFLSQLLIFYLFIQDG